MVARDEAGFGKIDPFMAIADAAQMMSLNPVASSDLIYSDHDLRFI
jgi:phage terminase large subunit-like protein